jgi:hypothetical protein
VAIERIVGNRDGIKSLLNAPGVRADIYARGKRVQQAAGVTDHNLYLTETRAPRARSAVVTATEEARKNRSRLIRSVDAARG